MEVALGLDQAARRRIQQGLGAAGFDAGAADGLFGPRTRQAIRQWQSSRGAWASGYLTGAQVEVLRGVGGLPQLASVTPPAATPPPVSPDQENLFWQSVMNSTNPAEFEAYLRRFPNGVFSDLAEARLAALRAAAGGSSGASAAASADPRPQPGEVFRDCDVCPEMVVMPDSRLALGRYEVTVGEYLAFASATGGGAGRGCTTFGGDSWRDVYWYQTYLHPVTCVSWDDAQTYVSWLSRMAGATYRLPSQAEWEQAAAGSQPGCAGRGFMMGTCQVGSYGANGVGLSDMVGNLWEWTEDCEEGDCSRRVLRGGSWKDIPGFLRATVRLGNAAGSRLDTLGFRVARTLN